jgi:tRNA modification GTPase
VPVLLVDTAGIREDAGKIEALGIEKAKEQYQRADVSIFLLDGSQPLSGEDLEIARTLDPDKKLIVVINKADLPQAFGRAEALGILPFEFAGDWVVQVSLIDDGALREARKSGAAQAGGVAFVERALEAFALGGAAAGSSLLVTKARHKTLLEAAAAEVAEARAALAAGSAPEFFEVNIRAAWEALGDMIGETASDDVIDRVFEEFSVGK